MPDACRGRREPPHGLREFIIGEACEAKSGARCGHTVQREGTAFVEDDTCMARSVSPLRGGTRIAGPDPDGGAPGRMPKC